MKSKCPPGTFCLENGSLIIIIILVVIGIFIFISNKNKNDSSQDTNNEEIQNLKNDFLVEKNKNLILNQQVQQTEQQNQQNEKKIQNIENKNIINNNQNNLDNPLFVVDRRYQRAVNPFLPPLRSNPNEPVTSLSLQGLGVPINIPTRGFSQDFQQVGIITGGNQILPLFGRTIWNGSNKWNYFTSTDSFQSVKIPIQNKKRDCTQEFGCDELYDKDKIFIPAYNKEFEVSIYRLDSPRYIPYI